MTGSRSLADLLGEVALAARSAVALAREDPAHLAVQAARRCPTAWRRRASALLRAGARPGTGRTVVAHWLAGHDDEARDAVAALVESGHLPRVVAEVAVLLDVDLTGVDLPTATRARALARRGDLGGAIVAAGPDTRQGRRLASEIAVLAPGFELRTQPPDGETARPSGRAPRVLHLLTNSLPHTTSGYAVRSQAVLRAQAEAGLEVRAVTRPGYPVTVGRLARGRTDVVDGVTYARLLPRRLAPTAVGRLAQHLEEVRAVARDWRPDVLQTTTNYTGAVVTRALARELDVPWVYEVRGVLEDTWVASFPAERRAAVRASERYRLLRARETELTRAADAVVVLGETVRDDLVERGVDPARITVAPNAVDAELLTRTTEPAAARRALGLPTEGFWVGTVSSLVGYEGVATLIEAVALARAGGLDVRACVVGDGVARPELLRLVAELGLGGAVLLPGRVPPSEATGWYEALDVVGVTRLDTEVTRTVVPLKPMAAMALGRPLIASDLPALAELVGRPGSGLLTAPEDPRAVAEAIERLANDAALRASLGRAGRAFAATRTWDAVGRTYRELVEAIA